MDPRDAPAVLPEQSARPHPDSPERPKPWWTHRRPWWELFLQFFAVLLGVLLATAVTSWREERSLNETRDRALRGLANEVAHNRSFLEARVGYYRQVLAGIERARAEKGERARLSDVPEMRGFNPPFFRRAAYEVSFHSGAFVRFEYGLAERIATTYALQEWMLAGVGKTTDFLIGRLGETFELRDLRMVFEDWVQMGDELLGYQAKLQLELPAPNPYYGEPAGSPAAAEPAPAGLDMPRGVGDTRALGEPSTPNLQGPPPARVKRRQRGAYPRTRSHEAYAPPRRPCRWGALPAAWT